MKLNGKSEQEKMAADAIAEIHPPIDKKYEPNGSTTCPDWLFHYQCGDVVLEIVNGTDFCVKEDEITKRPLAIAGERDLTTQLSEKLKVLLKPEETLILNLKIGDRKVVVEVKAIFSRVERLYTDNKFVCKQYDRDDGTTFFKSEPISLNDNDEELEGYQAKVILTDYYANEAYDVLKVIPVNYLFDQPLEAKELKNQYRYILSENMIGKHEKLLKIPNEAHRLLPRWLAIINTNAFAKIEDYQAAYEVCHDHVFDRVFIIFPENKKAYELKKVAECKTLPSIPVRPELVEGLVQNISQDPWLEQIEGHCIHLLRWCLRCIDKPEKWTPFS